MKKIAFIFLLQYFVVSYLFSQEKTYTLEPLDSLFAHVITTHESETLESLANFKNLKDYKWLHLLPTLGIRSYDGKNYTPTISINSSQWVTYLQRKDDKKYRMTQLEQQSGADLEATLFRLKGIYTRLERQLNELEIRHEIMQINQKLYEIEEEKYKNVDIDTEEFLRSQRSRLTQLSDFQNFKVSIFQTISEIENITKRALDLRAPLL